MRCPGQTGRERGRLQSVDGWVDGREWWVGEILISGHRAREQTHDTRVGRTREKEKRGPRAERGLN